MLRPITESEKNRVHIESILTDQFTLRKRIVTRGEIGEEEIVYQDTNHYGKVFLTIQVESGLSREGMQDTKVLCKQDLEVNLLDRVLYLGKEKTVVSVRKTEYLQELIVR